jgi:glycine cleavage system pyridoxal-binding protein P
MLHSAPGGFVQAFFAWEKTLNEIAPGRILGMNTQNFL